MAIDYGSGDLGSVTISSNTTLDSVQSYENLTVQSGVTVTIPHGGMIRVADTLDVDGTIKSQLRVGSGGSGDADGGDAGGSSIVIAKNVTGSGAIRVDGQNGQNANGTAGESHGSDGLPPMVAGRTDQIITKGAQGGRKGNDGGNGGTASARDSVTDRDVVGVWLDEWMIPSAQISSLPTNKMLSGGGAGGGKGGNGNGYNNNEGGGAGGGAGGSFGGHGGNGGGGNGGSYNGNGGNGPDGGAGGGAGGFLVLISDYIASTVSTNAIGGDGGNGSNNGNGSSGGGGGGSGGVILVFSPGDVPDYNVSGGSRGTGSGGNYNHGNSGDSGYFMQLPREVLQ